MPSTVTSADGTRIGFESSGAGPGLVLVGGALARGADYRGLAAALGDSFTVHLVDRRGRGASGPQGPGYGIQKEIDDLAAIVEATGARYVFGHSYGGLVALRAALGGAVPLTAVVAYEPGASIDGSVPDWYLPALGEAVTRRRPARAVAYLVRGLQADGAIGRLPMPLLTAASWLTLATFARPLRRSVEALPAELRAIVALDGPASEYAGLAIRTQIMIGERCQPYIRQSATAVCSASPGTSLTVLPGLGHAGPARAPRRVAAVVRQVCQEPS